MKNVETFQVHVIRVLLIFGEHFKYITFEVVT